VVVSCYADYLFVDRNSVLCTFIYLQTELHLARIAAYFNWFTGVLRD
jgi:hypothetical protein